ncbi:helix-turn-helix transcriptional regulator [Serratia symbiotica]|uniref:Transcriptional regulator GerE domain protein n=2 Tax=Serratia symbiotica TaxID=138074 RepID=A0A455VJ01_9GAMM|nr:LuxR C-terminal-related transcriptional regulator [Serratia symbiotica]BBI93059.1 transcriptional regulator GerE domain protein [Serratia symbiotica]
MNIPIKQFCQSLTIPCGFTDAESEVYTNAEMTDILGMTVESSQVLDVFHAREEVMRDKKLPLSMLSTLPGGYKKPPQPWRFDFFPRFDEKNVYQGAFFYAQPFLFLSLLEYIAGESPYPVVLSQPNDMFTDREWDVLFLSLQRLSCKEIAKWLAIAIKTVEVHLNNIYRKAEVHHAHQLRKFCQEKRINHYIPPQLLPSGCQVISV